MHPRRFALIGGLIMLALGVVAFIPALSTFADWLPRLKVETSYGLFLGYFPMNVMNKVALIILGIGGIAAAFMPGTSLPASIRWSRWVFYITAALAVLGLIPSIDTLAGYWPLFGNEVWKHGVFAVLGAYFGYSLPMKVPDVDKSRVPDRESLVTRSTAPGPTTSPTPNPTMGAATLNSSLGSSLKPTLNPTTRGI